jgi:hypothetical protein
MTMIRKPFMNLSILAAALLLAYAPAWAAVPVRPGTYLGTLRVTIRRDDQGRQTPAKMKVALRLRKKGKDLMATFTLRNAGGVYLQSRTFQMHGAKSYYASGPEIKQRPLPEDPSCYQDALSSVSGKNSNVVWFSFREWLECDFGISDFEWYGNLKRK